MSARIVIVTPGQLGSNPRVVKEAEALHQAGYDVHVIATRVMAAVEPRDQAVLTQAAWGVTRVRFDQPGPWRRARLGQEVARRAFALWPRPEWADRAISAMTPALTRAALAHPAELYIAHYPPALPAAAAAARRHGARFVFDAEDFHPGDLSEDPKHAAQTAQITAIEGRYLPQAAYVSAASPGIAAAYGATYGLPTPQVILNTFPKGQAPAAPTAAGTAVGPSLYWMSQVRGPDRGLEAAVAALAQARTRPHLYLRGHGRAAFDTALRAQAQALGVADRVHFLPPEPPDQMVALAAAYDAGLVGETGITRNRQIALTNKQFTYLLAGIPAVMSDIPAHRSFAETAPGAVRLYRTDDPAALAVALDDLLGDPTQLAQARAAAHALGQSTLNWEAEVPKLRACIETALA